MEEKEHAAASVDLGSFVDQPHHLDYGEWFETDLFVNQRAKIPTIPDTPLLDFVAVVNAQNQWVPMPDVATGVYCYNTGSTQATIVVGKAQFPLNAGDRLRIDNITVPGIVVTGTVNVYFVRKVAIRYE